MAGFDLGVRQWAEKQGENADKWVRDVVLEVTRRVVIRSPVDTGRFRANWRVSADARSTGMSAAIDPSGAASISAAGSAVPVKAAGQVYFLQNNLPYARRLEYGWSQQAPAGMVRLTVAEFSSIADAEKPI